MPISSQGLALLYGNDGEGLRDSVVLCYHAVSDEWPSELAVSTEALADQVDLLIGRGYEPVTFTELAAGGLNGGSKAFAVTFDDAYQSVFDRALPMLEERRAPATVFVPTAFAGYPGPMRWGEIDQWIGSPHEEELRCLSWDHLGHLRDSGWEIGSHGRRHAHLTDLDDFALSAELLGSREDLRRELGINCRSIAFPFGESDARVRAAAEDAGYSAAASMHVGPPERLRWPRVGVYPIDDAIRFRLKVSPAVRRIRASSVGKAVERLHVSIPAVDLAPVEDALAYGII